MIKADADKIINDLATVVGIHGSEGKKFEKAKAKAVDAIMAKTEPLAKDDLKQIKEAIQNSSMIVKDARHLLVFNEQAVNGEAIRQIAEALKAEGLDGAFIIVKGDAKKAIDVQLL